MAPKTITVVAADGHESTRMLSTETGYQNLLKRFGVESIRLVMNGRTVDFDDFESLLDGRKYTLGPPQLQTQPTTPRVPRHDSEPRIIPPSTGKEPKYESAPKASPSSEEGVQEGLSFVAGSPSMRVSSNCLSIDFVEDLQKITTLQEVDKRFSTAANYVFRNWHHERHKGGKEAYTRTSDGSPELCATP